MQIINNACNSISIIYYYCPPHTPFSFSSDIPPQEEDHPQGSETGEHRAAAGREASE